jgi:hypothetical protein
MSIIFLLTGKESCRTWSDISKTEGLGREEFWFILTVLVISKYRCVPRELDNSICD